MANGRTQQQVAAPHIVVDLWKVRPGQRETLEHLLRELVRQFRSQPEILSVDFTRLEDGPDRYLAVFRYESAEARKAFVATEELKASHSRLSDLWDLDSTVYRGDSIER